MEVKKTHYYNGNTKEERYYENDMLHRLDGPARISYYEDGSINEQFYYIDDIEYEELKYYMKVGVLNRDKEDIL